MAGFFIQRPIFAWVIAIVIMLAGIGAIRLLPLEQYPDIAPPRVSINATYTGAAADTIENSVTQVIEQYMKGIDNLTYMSASSTASGTASISLTFDAGPTPMWPRCRYKTSCSRPCRACRRSYKAWA
ncbi:MAG TPA: efflux RND transporter permease subunit [Methylophilus sp.]